VIKYLSGMPSFDEAKDEITESLIDNIRVAIAWIDQTRAAATPAEFKAVIQEIDDCGWGEGRLCVALHQYDWWVEKQGWTMEQKMYELVDIEAVTERNIAERDYTMNQRLAAQAERKVAKLEHEFNKAKAHAKQLREAADTETHP